MHATQQLAVCPSDPAVIKIDDGMFPKGRFMIGQNRTASILIYDWSEAQSKVAHLMLVGEVPYTPNRLKQSNSTATIISTTHIGTDDYYKSRSLITNSCIRDCLVLDTKFVIVVAIALFAEPQ